MIKIVGLQKVTLLDYPGHIAASVFLAGCNLNCGFCHNRWMIDAASAPEAISWPDLLDFLATRQGLLDGVCLSGGEPTLTLELPEMLRRIKALGFDTKLDTNGLLPGRLVPLFEQRLVDYVAMDIKAPLDARYADLTGTPVDLEALRHSMALIRAGAPAYEFRTTVAPGLNANDLLAIAAEILPDESWVLQLFRAAEGVRPDVAVQPAMGADELETLVAALRLGLPRVSARGT